MAGWVFGARSFAIFGASGRRDARARRRQARVRRRGADHDVAVGRFVRQLERSREGRARLERDHVTRARGVDRRLEITARGDGDRFSGRRGVRRVDVLLRERLLDVGIRAHDVAARARRAARPAAAGRGRGRGRGARGGRRGTGGVRRARVGDAAAPPAPGAAESLLEHARGRPDAAARRVRAKEKGRRFMPQ